MRSCRHCGSIAIPPSNLRNCIYICNKCQNVKNRGSRVRRYARLKAIVVAAKSVPCAGCGEVYPYWIMQFDHLDGDNKKADVSYLVRSGSEEALMRELEKCEPVCANCHADRTYRRTMGLPIKSRQPTPRAPGND
jgi:DNA-directed RNA polymerase subunit M/transcription elongation factor TFIIS